MVVLMKPNRFARGFLVAALLTLAGCAACGLLASGIEALAR